MTSAFNILAKAVLTAALPRDRDIPSPVLQVKSVPVQSRETAGPVFMCSAHVSVPAGLWCLESDLRMSLASEVGRLWARDDLQIFDRSRSKSKLWLKGSRETACALNG